MRAYSGCLLAAAGLLALGGRVEAAHLHPSHPTHVEYPVHVAYLAHIDYPGAFDCLRRDPVFIVDQGPTYELTVKTRVYPYVGDSYWRYDGYYGYPPYRAYRPMGEHGYRPYGYGYRPYGRHRHGADAPGAKIIRVPAHPSPRPAIDRAAPDAKATN